MERIDAEIEKERSDGCNHNHGRKQSKQRLKHWAGFVQSFIPEFSQRAIIPLRRDRSQLREIYLTWGQAED